MWGQEGRTELLFWLSVCQVTIRKAHILVLTFCLLFMKCPEFLHFHSCLSDESQCQLPGTAAKNAFPATGMPDTSWFTGFYLGLDFHASCRFTFLHRAHKSCAKKRESRKLSLAKLKIWIELKNQITTIGLTSNSLNNSCLVLKYRTIADWLDMALISCLWDLRWQKCRKSWFEVKWHHSFLFLLIGFCYQVVNIIYTLQHNISAESCQ